MQSRMSKRPTIIDIARAAGVSKSTVSRVISGNGKHVSDENRQRVLAAVETLGYIRDSVASGMRTQRTNTIMLVIPDITNPFWPEVARGVQDVMMKAEIAVVLANSDWNADQEARFTETLISNRLDGLIINPIFVTQQDLHACSVPTVILGSRPYGQFDRVGSDSRACVRMALSHLISLGHRRIGLILGQREGNYRRTWLQMGLEILQEAQLLPTDEYIFTVPFRQQAGKSAMTQLMVLPQPPTAVFCQNDLLAIGAIEAARNLNIDVPEQVSIIGIDDIFAASTTMPALTTIAKQKYVIGVKAANMLLERLQADEQPPARQILLPGELQVRKSTGPLPASPT